MGGRGQVEVELICDDVQGHYEVISMGWLDKRRVHDSIVHVDLRGDNVWLQYDGTNRPMAEAQMDAGIPKSRSSLPSTSRRSGSTLVSP